MWLCNYRGYVWLVVVAMYFYRIRFIRYLNDQQTKEINERQNTFALSISLIFSNGVLMSNTLRVLN